VSVAFSFVFPEEKGKDIHRRGAEPTEYAKSEKTSASIGVHLRLKDGFFAVAQNDKQSVSIREIRGLEIIDFCCGAMVEF